MRTTFRSMAPLRRCATDPGMRAHAGLCRRSSVGVTCQAGWDPTRSRRRLRPRTGCACQNNLGAVGLTGVDVGGHLVAVTLVTGGPMSRPWRLRVEGITSIACIRITGCGPQLYRCSSARCFSLTRIYKATPGQVTASPGSQRSRASAERVSAHGASAWQPVVFAATAVRKLAETKYPPHEAHQRTAALIGVVRQRSVRQRFSSEARRPSSKIETRCSLSR